MRDCVSTIRFGKVFITAQLGLNSQQSTFHGPVPITHDGKSRECGVYRPAGKSLFVPPISTWLKIPGQHQKRSSAVYHDSLTQTTTDRGLGFRNPKATHLQREVQDR